MTAALYREFVIRNGSIWSNVVAFVRANAKVFADRGEPLRVIVTAEERKRNSEQNRFYFGVVLRDISAQAWVDGQQFGKAAWHEYFATQYGVMEEMRLPFGEIVLRRKSTTDMTVGEFSTYMNQIQAYAANTLGVEFD
ncbi:recombination protein NinB [Burkholderia gladioli]|uniref:recombination protein NinB n=1 Tax=Burkholderia gladioli TaxID=28095 RepID=UPI00163E8681|nr:recombination protein NinB [Burkholderia gladioli]